MATATRRNTEDREEKRSVEMEMAKAAAQAAVAASKNTDLPLDSRVRELAES